MKFAFTRISGNIKTGPIPVTMSERSTCPDNCSLKASGCYAESGNVRLHWNRVADKGIDANMLFSKIKVLPKGQLWRHNVAGDLPAEYGFPNEIDTKFIQGLIYANHGRKGFTYTHHRVIGADCSAESNRVVIRTANANGFTVNLSADNLDQADSLHALGIGPVVTIVPIDSPKVSKTPAGNTVVLCPATYRDDVQCSNCGICAVSTRKAIIGFPVHGASKRKAEKVFFMKREG